MSLSIILPTYNEKENILLLIDKIIKSIKNLNIIYEIIVIDDNSPDKTGDICKKYFLNDNSVKVYIRKNNKGFASAILYGIKKSKEEIIIVMDTDFSHNPLLIPQMLSYIKRYDVVIGSRYVHKGGGENKKRYWLSRIYNIYLGIILRIPISDFLFGYFCVRRRFLFENKLDNRYIFSGFGDYFIRLAFFAYKAGGKFKEIPAFYKDRIHGVSKSNIFKMLLTYTTTSLKLLLNPSLP